MTLQQSEAVKRLSAMTCRRLSRETDRTNVSRSDLRVLLDIVNRPLPLARDIAKIINPKAFDPPYDKFDDVHDAVNADRRDALAKAQDILALIGGADPQGGA